MLAPTHIYIYNSWSPGIIYTTTCHLEPKTVFQHISIIRYKSTKNKFTHQDSYWVQFLMPCIDGKTNAPPNGRIAAALHAAISNHPDARWQTLELLADGGGLYKISPTWRVCICIWNIFKIYYINFLIFPPRKGLQLVSRHSWSSSQVRALHWYPTLDEPLHSKPESVWIVEVKNWQENRINLLFKTFDVAIYMLPQSSGEKTK